MIRDIYATTPEMFMAFMPDYGYWKKEFEKNDINSESILVGHSCGSGFLIRWLSENPKVKIDKVILVAPWIDPFNSEINGFFDFKIDPKLVSRANKFVVLNSTNDMDDVQKTVEIIKEEIEDLEVIEFKNKGHFCLRDLGTEKFPELLEIILD